MRDPAKCSKLGHSDQRQQCASLTAKLREAGAAKRPKRLDFPQSLRAAKLPLTAQNSKPFEEGLPQGHPTPQRARVANVRRLLATPVSFSVPARNFG